jgi:hypothetical protein
MNLIGLAHLPEDGLDGIAMLSTVLHRFALGERFETPILSHYRSADVCFDRQRTTASDAYKPG